MKTIVGVFHGEAAVPVGDLHFVAGRGKEACSFAYRPEWLADPRAFAIDPFLPLNQGHQFPRGGGRSVFFGCFADSEPDGWGRMVIQRDRKKRGLTAAATSLDFLLDVHDESRTGALRFSENGMDFLSTPAPGKRAAPPLLELKDLLRASAAIERNTESAADLRLLLDRGSPPGGMRPKCTVVDDDGNLSIGKFPSATDTRDMVRGEMLALALARKAGINAAAGELVVAAGKPVAVIRRFDRDGQRRVMYLSGRSFIGATDTADYAYTDLADSLRQHGARPNADIEELWRRIVFSVLITNVDDHLNNHGFLRASGNTWMLSPAFDLNPAPERHRVLNTWITPDAGPDATIDNAMLALKPMGIDYGRGLEILAEVSRAVAKWRPLAASVGMKPADIKRFEDAFEHEERQAVQRVLANKVAAGLPGSRKPR